MKQRVPPTSMYFSQVFRKNLTRYRNTMQELDDNNLINDCSIADWTTAGIELHVLAKVAVLLSIP